MIRFRILCTTVDLDFSLINYPEPEIPNSWSNFHLCFIQKIALINIEEASSDRRSEDASYSLQAILSQSKPGQCNHSTFFVNQLKKDLVIKLLATSNDHVTVIFVLERCLRR